MSKNDKSIHRLKALTVCYSNMQFFLAIAVTRKNSERFKVHFFEVDDVIRNVDFRSKFFLAHLGFEISIVDLVKT